MNALAAANPTITKTGSHDSIQPTHIHSSWSFRCAAVAAYLEVQGDACFQSGLYNSSGTKQVGWFAAGSLVLICYRLFLNPSKIDCGKLLGIYVVLFFLVAQFVAKIQFHQSPSKPINVGGAFVVAGVVIMIFWKA